MSRIFLSMKCRNLAPTKEISSMIMIRNWLYYFVKLSNLSELSGLEIDLLNGMSSAECRVVPPKLQATLPVYASSRPLIFSGSLSIVLLYRQRSPWYIAFAVKVFPVPAPPVRNKCSGVVFAYCFSSNMSLTMATCSLLSFLYRL